MAELSSISHSDAFPRKGIVRERLEKAKREAIDLAMEKGESWTTKLLNGQSGVTLDDLPRLLKQLDLKIVSADKVCVDPDLAKAYEVIARKAAIERSLLFEDAE